MSKYHAKKVIMTDDGTMFEVAELKKYNITDVEGNRFDSKMEAQYYLVLLEMQRRGEIQTVQLQPKFILQANPKIMYTGDFLVTEPDGTMYVVDVKGMETQAFRLKLRLFKATHPNLPLYLVTKKSREWKRKRAI